MRKYLILQTTAVPSGGSITPSIAPSSIPAVGEVNPSGGQGFPSARLPTSQGLSSAQNLPQIPQTQSTFPSPVGNGEFQSGSTVDPTVKQHTLSSGGRADIVQVGEITASQQEAYTGDDITFSVTIKNQAPYKKFVRQLCWESDEGNFGCSPGFNLDPGQVFSISNNGRFVSSGTKSVWITWTQDGANYYNPLHSKAAEIRIL